MNVATEAVAPALSNPAQVNYDALALSIAGQNNSIAAQANALTLATAVMGLLALLGLVGWAFYVKWRAENIAREEARVAVYKWLDKEGPRLVQDLATTMNLLRSDNVTGDDGDEIAYALAEEPVNGRKEP